jgi:outer membrane receptor protein involved in Fe transport
MADQSVSPWQGSVFTLGLDHKWYGGQASRTNNPNFHLDKTFRETAVYLLGRQNLLGDCLTLDAGIRLDMQSLFGNEWVPRLGLSYKPVESSILKLSAAKGFRNPTMRELYVNLANGDLQPERMMNYEVSFTQLSPNKRFKGEMAVYLSKGENMIQTVVIAGVPKYFNTGTFSNKGFEAALQYRFPFALNLFANYSYIHCEKPILATPEHQFNVGAEYRPGKLSLTANLQQVQNYYLNVSNTPVKENFTLLDAKIGYQLTKQVSIFCKGENLLDKAYAMTFNYPMPGATVMTGLKMAL